MLRLAGSRRRRGQRGGGESARVEADVTAFGERLGAHSFSPGMPGTTEEMAADYASALDAYELAGREARRNPDAALRALDDGTHALARLDARLAGEPLPEWLAPCFFDPRHGRSVREVRWAPEGGVARMIPVCAADAVRLDEGQPPIATGHSRPAPKAPAAPRRSEPAGSPPTATPSAPASRVVRGVGPRKLSLRGPQLRSQAPVALVVRITSPDRAEVCVKGHKEVLGEGPLSVRVPVPAARGRAREVPFSVVTRGSWEAWLEAAESSAPAGRPVVRAAEKPVRAPRPAPVLTKPRLRDRYTPQQLLIRGAVVAYAGYGAALAALGHVTQAFVGGLVLAFAGLMAGGLGGFILLFGRDIWAVMRRGRLVRTEYLRTLKPPKYSSQGQWKHEYGYTDGADRQVVHRRDAPNGTVHPLPYRRMWYVEGAEEELVLLLTPFAQTVLVLLVTPVFLAVSAVCLVVFPGLLIHDLL
ncbi:hypothetical protein ACFOZ0_06830 [Streptomyces yaanensis]|uniref:Uncharacterized protein n=1 Tax=Streptomyces yaanensis TaxID=1142239 RepID=A0ABV7SC24_9ACTN|nr:hypothetical protein [Streptomyces sp. CGMCC 4.7035]WNC02509.1 hypothetical protein Q2K21_33100 [Streptomyces sp. CGMCC 4.7035]